MRKRLLICSHAYVSPENLIKPRLLSAPFNVALVVPKHWLAMGRRLNTSEVEHKLIKKEGVPPRRWVSSGNYSVFPMKTFFSGNSGKYFYQPFGLMWAFAKFHPEIIYVEEEPWTPVAFELIFCAKLFGAKKKVIFTWENIDLPLSWWQKAIKRFVLGSVDLVVAGNKEAKGLVETYFGEAKLVDSPTSEVKSAETSEVIPRRVSRGSVKVFLNPQFGVNPNVFKPEARSQKLGAFFTVGFVGRFVAEKGIDTLIEALALLPRDCRLLLVSTTSLPEEFKSLAVRSNVLDQIEVVEKIPHEEMPAYFNQMDVLVLPSKTTPTWKEQFGRVLIEAMACGVPVVGSSSGAISEVIGGASLIFQEGNASDLAKQILKIKETPKKSKELSKKGYRMVRKKYTHEKVVEGLVKALLD